MISVSVYIEGRHESTHVVVGRFLGEKVYMYLADLGPVMSLVGKMDELLAPEALYLAKVPRLPLDIIGVSFSIGGSYYLAQI